VFNRILGGVGRSLMTVGTLMLLFVAYQLWGTGLQEARSQKGLANEFEQVLASTTTTPTTATTKPGDDIVDNGPVAAIPDWLPEEGKAVAVIRIPKIGVTRTVVEGVTVDELKRGVGHYPTSPLPGQKGNVSMAGHRTTYGQPFHNVDKLDKGDRIEFTTVQGDFVYEVESLEIVKPSDTQILDDKGDNRLTLIACHPKYSAAERIIVHAKLLGSPKPTLPGQDKVREQAGKQKADDPLASENLDGNLSGKSQARTPAVVWGLICAAIWFATWLLQTALRRRFRRDAHIDQRKLTRKERLVAWTPYLAGLPIFLVALYCFFENFSLLLPANY
jgi:sortase A